MDGGSFGLKPLAASVERSFSTVVMQQQLWRGCRHLASDASVEKYVLTGDEAAAFGALLFSSESFAAPFVPNPFGRVD